MRLYVARHTESNYNVDKRLNSDPSVNVHLTNKGMLQAKELAKELAGIKLDTIYISQLPRTKQTADIINKYHDVPLVTDGRLNDNASGFEGKAVEEYLKAFHASQDGWREAFNGGESLEQARNRVNDFLNSLKETSYSSVLVVSHGYVLECIYGILHGVSSEYAATFQLPQGEYALFEI